MKETITKCKGKLGESYNLVLNHFITMEDKLPILQIKIRLNKNMDVIPVVFNEKPSTIRLLINNMPVAKENVYLDFTNKDSITLLSYQKRCTNKDTELLQVEAELLIEDDSEYLTNTKINTGIVVSGLLEPKLVINLNSVIQNNKVICNPITNIVPDFLQYKIDENPWTKLESDNFTFKRTNKNQYVQVRGKYNGVYSYSNNIKIINE